MAKLNNKNQKKTKKSKFGRIDSKITLRVKQTKLLFYISEANPIFHNNAI